jgi:hypothetical protein
LIFLSYQSHRAPSLLSFFNEQQQQKEKKLNLKNNIRSAPPILMMASLVRIFPPAATPTAAAIHVQSMLTVSWSCFVYKKNTNKKE